MQKRKKERDWKFIQRHDPGLNRVPTTKIEKRNIDFPQIIYENAISRLLLICLSIQFSSEAEGGIERNIDFFDTTQPTKWYKKHSWRTDTQRLLVNLLYTEIDTNMLFFFF